MSMPTRSLMFRCLLLTLVAAMLCAVPGCGGGASAPTGKWVGTDPNDAENSATLEFLSDTDVKVSFAMGPMNMSFDCKYTWTADKVNIKSPMPDDPDDMVLTRSGNTMTGEMAGDALTFTKQ